MVQNLASYYVYDRSGIWVGHALNKGFSNVSTLSITLKAQIKKHLS